MTQFLQNKWSFSTTFFFCALINQFRIENGEREKKKQPKLYKRIRKFIPIRNQSEN